MKMKRISTSRCLSGCLLAVCALGLHAQPAEGRLERLFELAEKGNSSLQARLSTQSMAELQLKTAQTARLPELNLQARFSYLGDARITDRNLTHRHRAPMPHYGNYFALEASQTIYAGGAVTAGIEMDKLQQKGAQLGVEQERQQVRLLIAGHYLDICQLNNEEQVYLRHIELTERLIEQMKARIAAGTALKNDLTRHELTLENLRLALIRVKDRRSVAVFGLKQAIGATPSLNEDGREGMDYAFDYENFRVDTTALNAPELLSVENSPLLRQASTGTDIARQAVRLERSERLPKLTLVAGGTTDGPITVEVPPINKNLNYWFVGVGLKYNISSLYKNSKSLQRARLGVEEAQWQQKALTEQLEQALQAERTAYRQSFSELKTYRKSTELAEQNYNIIRNRYLNGLALVTDMTDAATTLLEANLQAANAEVRIAYAYYKMKFTTGTL